MNRRKLFGIVGSVLLVMVLAIPQASAQESDERMDPIDKRSWIQLSEGFWIAETVEGDHVREAFFAAGVKGLEYSLNHYIGPKKTQVEQEMLQSTDPALAEKHTYFSNVYTRQSEILALIRDDPAPVTVTPMGVIGSPTSCNYARAETSIYNLVGRSRAEAKDCSPDWCLWGCGRPTVGIRGYISANNRTRISYSVLSDSGSASRSATSWFAASDANCRASATADSDWPGVSTGESSYDGDCR